jgi:hypothetical protein
MIRAFTFLLLVVSLSLPQKPSGVLRLRVRVKQTDSSSAKGLQRKRFFLIRGTLEQNRALISAINEQPIVTRDCYYQRLGASQALIDWLKVSDCESVYCRVIEKESVAAVPEFATAFSTSVKEFGSDDTARKWLPTNLPANLRDGFYRDRQKAIAVLTKLVETSTIQSVMTDRNGTAYFTDLEPGAYVVSNLIPTEIGQSLATWNCEIQVKPGDIATEKPYLISNKPDRTVKCVAVERPLPACTRQ